MTAQAFLFYSFAVVGYVGQEVFNRVFYALKQFQVPMRVSLVCLAINVAGNLLLGSWGLIGLSASTALAMLVYAIIMAALAHRQLGGCPWERFCLMEPVCWFRSWVCWESYGDSVICCRAGGLLWDSWCRLH